MELNKKDERRHNLTITKTNKHQGSKKQIPVSSNDALQYLAETKAFINYEHDPTVGTREFKFIKVEFRNGYFVTTLVPNDSFGYNQGWHGTIEFGICTVFFEKFFYRISKLKYRGQFQSKMAYYRDIIALLSRYYRMPKVPRQPWV